MAGPVLPKGGIKLHGAEYGGKDSEVGSTTAVLVRLDEGMIQSMKKASHAKDELHFLTGSTPKLRIGGRTIDLTLTPDAFRNELYVSTRAGSLSDLRYAGLIGHRALVSQRVRKPAEGESGSDEALAALKSSLASLEQEKQANRTNIQNSLLAVPKSRFDAAKKHKRFGNAGGQPMGSFSPASTPQRDPAPTSAPVSASEVRSQAMRTALVHLLAMRPASTEEISSKTHIPKDDLSTILQKSARVVDGEWHLGDRAYKELDVWTFKYSSQLDRQSAIDNAIRAYDRLRVGKEEKLWQNLLPKEDRGKGIVLSRLHLGQQVTRGNTPNQSGTTPAIHGDVGEDSEPPSKANAPRLGASTPRPSSSKGDMMKRILSAKDPKNVRAAAEKKRKEMEKEAAREAAVSDRETAKAAKRQTVKKVVQPKVKSAEIVHSSDDESGEEGEVKDDDDKVKRVDSKLGLEKGPGLNSQASPDSNSDAGKAKTQGAKRKELPDPAKSIASLAKKVAKTSASTTGKVTPRTTTGLSAPSSQHNTQRSPQKNGTRPSVPSPLGAARPRVASDVSNRNGVGVQRVKPGADTPQAGSETTGTRKRQGTITSTTSAMSSSSDKAREDAKGVARVTKPAAKAAPSAAANGTPKVSVNGATNGVKRKASDLTDDNAPKHRKTTSASSQSHTSTSITSESTARTSPDVTFDSGSSDSAASVMDTITYSQGVNLAEKFRNQYYPAYAAMYDALAAKEAKGEKVGKDERDKLWAMHRRLEQMKREIQIASEREHAED